MYSPNDSIDRSITKELLKRDNYILPDSLFSFFPDKHKDLKIIKIFENAEKSEVSLFLSEFDPVILIEIYQSKDELLQDFVKEYDSQILSTIKSENKDYFIIASERELFKKYDTMQLKKKYSTLNDKSLVFYVKDLFKDIPFLNDSTTICELPSGYKILILKSGDEFVLPEDHFYDWPILPQNLRHGYRSGVAFKEGEPYIIYWTVAW